MSSFTTKRSSTPVKKTQFIWPKTMKLAAWCPLVSESINNISCLAVAGDCQFCHLRFCSPQELLWSHFWLDRAAQGKTVMRGAHVVLLTRHLLDDGSCTSYTLWPQRLIPWPHQTSVGVISDGKGGPEANEHNIMCVHTTSLSTKGNQVY